MSFCHALWNYDGLSCSHVKCWLWDEMVHGTHVSTDQWPPGVFKRCWCLSWYFSFRSFNVHVNLFQSTTSIWILVTSGQKLLRGFCHWYFNVTMIMFITLTSSLGSSYKFSSTWFVCWIPQNISLPDIIISVYRQNLVNNSIWIETYIFQVVHWFHDWTMCSILHSLSICFLIAGLYFCWASMEAFYSSISQVADSF